MISERSGIVDLATRNNIDGVRQLLRSNPGAVNEQDQYEETPLTRASFNNNKEMVVLLLSAGATVDLGNKWDERPLFWAVASKKKDVVDVLLAAGANVDLQNKNGYSPLFLAAANNNKEVAEMLLKAGADVDLPAKDGKTALMMAENNGFSEMVTLLKKQAFKRNAPKEVIWGRSRIMIVGEGRAGKTSFYRSMKGMHLSEESPSTCGLEKSNVRFRDIGDKRQEISLDPNPLANDLKNILSVAATKEIKLRYEESKKQKNMNNENISKLDTKEVSFSSLSSEKDGHSTLELNQMPQKKIIRNNIEEKDLNICDMDVVRRDLPLNLDDISANNVSTESKDPSKIVEPVEEEKGVPVTLLGNISHKDIDISVIDYGGQSIFHCFHHLFLKPYGVYCILFNMQKFLTDEVNTLYHIRYWYNTIILHTSDQKNGKVDETVPIFIVGSHRDKLENKSDMILISKKIQNMLKDSPGFTNLVSCPDNLVELIPGSTETKSERQDELYFFPVNNSQDNQSDTVFQHLMITMFKVISGSSYVKEKNSFDYFLVLCKIEEKYLKVNVEKRNEILIFIKTINKTKLWAEKVLQFFVDKGVFLEFGDEIIFHFDTFLIRSITKVIYDPRYHNRDKLSKYEWDPEFQILMKRGVVSNSYIRKLLRKGTVTVENLETDAAKDNGAKNAEKKETDAAKDNGAEDAEKKETDAYKDNGAEDAEQKETDAANDNGAEDAEEKETYFIIKFMVANQLMICVDDKIDEKNKLYIIPSLLPESKLTYNRFLSPSALFFFKIPSKNYNGLNLGNCFMSDNLFYQLMCKLIELSKVTYVREDQDNLIFKDLIMIKLGAHVIVVKSFPEANCIQLHALNERIVQNYIAILTYLIENEITPRVDFDIIIDQKTIYDSTLGVGNWSKLSLEKNVNYNYKVLIHCPKNIKDQKTLPTLIVTLSNYDMFVIVEFHENKKEIQSLETDVQGFKLLLIINNIVGTLDEFRNQKCPKILNIDADDTTVNEKLERYLRSSRLESGSLYENYNTIKLFKSNVYTGNSAQRFYNAASRMYYGWEANSHDEDQMLYFKVAVSPTEIIIFFRCILYLNGSYYVTRQFPELLAGTDSPAKLLGCILKETLESLNPNMRRESKDSTVGYDVSVSYKILVCLVQLSSAITTAISTHPTESEELQQHHRKVEEAMKRLLSSESMREEARILSALLGINICPLLDRYKNRDEGLRKLRAAVFTDSIIVMYITEKENESNMYTLIGTWQVLSVIDNAFWNSSRICNINGTKISGKTCAGLQKKTNDRFKSQLSTIYCQLSYTSTNCSQLGSNPSLLLFLEFLSSMLNVILVIVISFQENESIFKDDLRSFLFVMVLGVLLRELGELHSGFFRFSQSLYGRSITTVFSRTAAVYLKDFWNMFDVMGLLSLLCWSILQFLYQPPYSPSVEMTLSLTLKLSAIPLTIGLLRYFIVLKDIGQFIILIFSMTFDLWRFGFIYLFILLGFGISLKAIFYEYEDFNNIYNLFISMFQMSLNTLSYDTFDYDEKRYVGQIILITMVLSVSIILVNAIIAKFGITFQNINANVSGIWAINKARYIARYLNNRSPALMLPPPLNIVIFAIYLVMRVCAWLCNIAVFFIPRKQIHNWWYAHADLIKDLSIGVCSSISLAIVSVIMLSFCAVVEACVFLSAVFPLCIVALIDNILLVDNNSLFGSKRSIQSTQTKNITGIINTLLESTRRIFDIGAASWGFKAHKILKFCISVFCYILYFFFRVIMFAVFFLCISIVSVVAIVALPLVVLTYFLLLLHDILMTFVDNMNFLRYRVIIMTHFLTKEGRDIWDLQIPKLLEDMKRKANPDNNTIDENHMPVLESFYKGPVDTSNERTPPISTTAPSPVPPPILCSMGQEYFNCDLCRSYLCGDCKNRASINAHLSRLNIISRIEWFYYNIAPEQSLRFIYDEYEFGLGKEFLWQMIKYLRLGVDKIPTKKGEWFYDSEISLVTLKENEKYRLLTPEDCDRIFDIEDEEDQSLSLLKRQLIEEIQRLSNASLEKIQQSNDKGLEKMQILVMEFMTKGKVFESKEESTEGKVFESKEESTEGKVFESKEESTEGKVFESKEESTEGPQDSHEPNAATTTSSSDLNMMDSRVKRYMQYFHAAKSTKLVEDGKHASRFALDD